MLAEKLYWRESDARTLIEAWRESGLTLASFSRRYGLNRQRLQRWAGRLGPVREPSELPEQMRFHPVRVASGGPSAQPHVLEMILDEGIQLRIPEGFDAAYLLEVLDALAGRRD